MPFSVILIILFLIIILGFLYIARQNRHASIIPQSILDKAKGIEDIGTIGPGQYPGETKTEDDHISIANVERIFKYAGDQEYWVAFVLCNAATEDCMFSLDEVSVVLKETVVSCDLSLLLEKVPEYMEPPYGNSYYDTRHYNYFTLGNRGSKHLFFRSRFKPVADAFSGADAIKITLTLYKIEHKRGAHHRVPFKTVTLISGFDQLRFKKIQSVDELIRIHGAYQSIKKLGSKEDFEKMYRLQYADRCKTQSENPGVLTLYAYMLEHENRDSEGWTESGYNEVARLIEEVFTETSWSALKEDLPHWTNLQQEIFTGCLLCGEGEHDHDDFSRSTLLQRIKLLPFLLEINKEKGHASNIGYMVLEYIEELNRLPAIPEALVLEIAAYFDLDKNSILEVTENENLLKSTLRLVLSR